MATTPDQKLHDLLKDFGTVMLVSRTAEGHLRARPMQVAEVEEDGTLWLMTERHSPKTREIAQDEHVNVAMQSSMKYVSLSGTADLIDDRARISRLWNEAWKVWFPGGKDDPNLTLLRVRGQTGEYWDNSGTSGLRYLIEAGRAYFSGTKPDVAGDPKIHGKVTLSPE